MRVYVHIHDNKVCYIYHAEVYRRDIPHHTLNFVKISPSLESFYGRSKRIVFYRNVLAYR